MNHEALRELTGAYALGALSGEEKRALEAHLASCAECAEEVRAFGDVARGLNDAVPQIDPPASLRGRVLAHVESLAAKSAAPSAVPQARSGQRFSGTPWLALAASLAAAVLGFYALSLRDRVQALQGELVEARQRAATAEQIVQTIQQRAENLQRTSDIVRAADVADFTLQGQGPGSAASGRAFVSRSRGVVFVAQNLPPLDPGKTYQLWVIPEGKGAPPVSAGVFAPESAGTASLTTALNVQNPAAVAVTLEPAGGVPAPTGPFYLLGSI
jgi:anti-sigma-K factor RskA